MKEALLSLELDYKKFLYLIPVISISGNWQVMSIYVSIMFFVFLFERFNTLSNIYLPKALIWFLLLIWGLYIAAISPKKLEGLQYYYGLFITPFFLFCIINSIDLTENFLDRIINLFIISASLLSITFVLSFIGSGFSLKTKITSIWEDYNIVSAFLMIVLMFNISFIINNNGKKNLLFYLSSGLIIIFGIFLTQTRGVWLAIIISIVFYIIRRPKVFLPATIITVIIISALALFFPQVIAERFLSVKYFGSDVSSLGRLQAWLSSIELIKQNPFFGYGFNSYIYLRDQVYGFYFVLVEHSHNTYLRGILEMGLIGFTLYFLFFFTSIYYVFSLAKQDTGKKFARFLDGLQLSFVGLVIVFMFEPYFSLFGLTAAIIWFLISITFNIKTNSKSYFTAP